MVEQNVAILLKRFSGPAYRPRSILTLLVIQFDSLFQLHVV